MAFDLPHSLGWAVGRVRHFRIWTFARAPLGAFWRWTEASVARTIQWNRMESFRLMRRSSFLENFSVSLLVTHKITLLASAAHLSTLILSVSHRHTTTRAHKTTGRSTRNAHALTAIFQLRLTTGCTAAMYQTLVRVGTSSDHSLRYRHFPPFFLCTLTRSRLFTRDSLCSSPRTFCCWHWWCVESHRNDDL